MTAFLTQTLFDRNGEKTSWPVAIDIPKKRTELDRPISGVLRRSAKGYVYNEQSACKLWLKFLTMGICLPVVGAAAKCKEIYRRVLHYPEQAEGDYDCRHIRNLTSIAWKAVIGWKGKSLYEYIEIYAMNELRYNNTDINSEMLKERSHRFKTGTYIAPCMQPLYHVSQYEPNKCQWLAKRCEKYAVRAILNQQCCPSVEKNLKDTFVQKQADVEFGGNTCYRQERICGILYKVECCAIRCWAIDCFCCMCCFWPTGRSVCVI